MAAWKKTLERMLADEKPNSYGYDEAVAILRQLGFEPPKKKPKGTHRMWRRRLDDGTSVIIGLVDKGRGTLKEYLVRDMVRQLRERNLIPSDLDQGSDDALES